MASVMRALGKKSLALAAVAAPKPNKAHGRVRTVAAAVAATTKLVQTATRALPSKTAKQIDTAVRKLGKPKQMKKVSMGDLPEKMLPLARRARRGLFGGKDVRFGNNISFSERKTRRTWLPNAHYKKFRSELLGRSLRLNVTPYAMRSMDKAGGLDNYILHTTPYKLRSEKAMELKIQLVERYNRLQLKSHAVKVKKALKDALAGVEVERRKTAQKNVLAKIAELTKKTSSATAGAPSS